MKKSKLVMFIAFLVLVFSSFTIKADEYQPKFNFKGIKQNDVAIEPVNGVYSIVDYTDPFIEFDLDNANPKKEYYIVSRNGNSTSGESFYSNSHGVYLILSNLNNYDDLEYTINLCDEFECNEVYDTMTIKFSFDFYEKINNSKAYVQKIVQNHNEIEPALSDYNHTARYEVNNLQMISLHVKGENFKDDVEYSICGGYSYFSCFKKILGSSLNEGVIVDVNPTTFENGFGGELLIKVNDIKVVNVNYRDGDTLYDANLSVNETGSIEDFTIDLAYKNNPEQEIELKDTNIYEQKGYVLLSDYHDENNPLSVTINGNDVFKDQDYEILIQGKKKGNVVYSKEVTVNGTNIIDGYKIDLDGYKASFPTDIFLYDEEFENILEITINNVRRKYILIYNSIGDFPSVDATIFYEDGKKNLSAFRGDGGFNWGGGIADTNVGAFNKYTHIYINYLGDKFLDNEEYDYTLEYGYLDESKYEYKYIKEIDKGKINGRILNNVGISFKVDNSNKYDMPSYKFTVRKGDELLYASTPTLSLIDGPVLANVSLSANNKNLYMQTDSWSYIATRNAPITSVVSGLGYDDKKTYKFNYCYQIDDDWENAVCKIIELSGKDLNSAKAKIKFDQKIGKDVEKISFTIDNYFQDDIPEYVVQGFYSITFVDSKDLFPTIDKYVLDNNSDLIKNISKETSVSNFRKNISVVNNGKVKIFDKTGSNEITNNVGTGMLLRVLDEFDQSVLDMDVVVKGDVTGDGSITITDLVKEKQELAGLDVLSGVYEVGGDITGSGSISVTDLVKMSRDVAGLEEIE